MISWPFWFGVCEGFVGGVAFRSNDNLEAMKEKSVPFKAKLLPRSFHILLLFTICLLSSISFLSVFLGFVFF